MTQRKGEIIIPKVDFENARITPRRAPSPKIGAGIGGWIEWQLIDRRGRAVRGGEQHNLFLDQGLDEIAVAPSLASAGWMTHAAVSTNSVPPEVGDVSLGGEVGRVGPTALAQGTAYPSDGVYQHWREWEFDFGQANGNLSKWGIARAASGRLVAAELFRDGAGDPIVITKTSDYKLRLRYTLQVSFSPIVLTASSFAIEGLGLISGHYRWHGGVGSYRGLDLRAFGYVSTGTTDTSGGGEGRGWAGAAAPAPYASQINMSTAVAGVDLTRVHSPFVSGEWTRSLTPTWGTGQANLLISAFAVGASWGFTGTARYPGFFFFIDEADHFTKDNEHTLTINDLLTVTWGRA